MRSTPSSLQTRLRSIMEMVVWGPKKNRFDATHPSAMKKGVVPITASPPPPVDDNPAAEKPATARQSRLKRKYASNSFVCARPKVSLSDEGDREGKGGRWAGVPKSRKRASRGWRGGCTHVMHGRSRMTIDPSMRTMPGRSTSGFQRRGRHYLHQPRSALRCSASRMKGELHPTKKRL